MIKTYEEYQEFKKTWKIDYNALVAKIKHGKQDRKTFKDDMTKCSYIQSVLHYDRLKAHQMLLLRTEEKENAIKQSQLKRAG